jgi:hypothetical protein
MKSLFAALAAAALLAFAAVPASAQPTDLHQVPVANHRCDPLEQIGRITFCNPLGR